MTSSPEQYLAVLAMIATRLAKEMSEHELPEVLLQADEISLREGERTLLQERMLEVFGDFANLQLLEVEESKPAREACKTTEAANAFAKSEEPAGAHPGQENWLDVNVASLICRSLCFVPPSRTGLYTHLTPRNPS